MKTTALRLMPLVAACALLSACTQPMQAPAVTVTGEAPAVAVRPAVMPALTPLERIAGYRLSALDGGPAPAVSVLGVAPPVSGANGQGQRFMVRPATHEVMKIDAAGNVAAWGGLGGEPGRFNQPESLSVTADRVYVADTGNHRVQVFDLEGRFVAAWGAFGNRPGQFHAPRAVEVTSGGMIVVTDDVRIQYFDPSGAHVAELPLVLPAAPAGGRAVLQSSVAAGPAGAAAIAPLSADIFDQMALFQLLAQTLRDAARASRSTEMAFREAALQAEAEMIRQAAEQRFSAAVTAGMMAMASSAITAPSAGAVGGAVASAGTMGSLTSRVGGLAPSSTAQLSKAGTVQRAPGGVGAIGAGKGSGVGSAIGRPDAKEADAKAREAATQTGDAAQQQADDLMRQMMDVIREVREKLAEIEQSSVETNRGIARNI